MKRKPTIYFAAGLFNARERRFNLHLANQLENRGYAVRLPQRDGFLMMKFREALMNLGLDERSADRSSRAVIYIMDLGRDLRMSDVILANLDEPIDEGVVVEQCFAKMMGKKSVGYRTDVRSPYGGMQDLFGGMHCFPGFICDSFIDAPSSGRDLADAGALSELSDLIERGIFMARPIHFGKTDYSMACVRQVCRNANLLLRGIKDIHSKAGIKDIANRYLENLDRMYYMFPKEISA